MKQHGNSGMISKEELWDKLSSEYIDETPVFERLAKCARRGIKETSVTRNEYFALVCDLRLHQVDFILEPAPMIFMLLGMKVNIT